MIATCTHRVQHQHGTLPGYVTCHCHCTDCSHAMATYHARRVHEGRPRRLNPTGTRRRIQALAAIGYSPASLAKIAGVDFHPADIAQGRTSFVYRSTAQLVAELYERLSMTPAPAGTMPERVSSAKARKLAARHNWAPPMAWLNIDDPTEQPTRWQRRVAKQLRAADHVAAVEDLEAIGYSRDEAIARAAEANGVQINTVTTAIARLSRRAA